MPKIRSLRDRRARRVSPYGFGKRPPLGWSAPTPFVGAGVIGRSSELKRHHCLSTPIPRPPLSTAQTDADSDFSRSHDGRPAGYFTSFLTQPLDTLRCPPTTDSQRGNAMIERARQAGKHRKLTQAPAPAPPQAPPRTSRATARRTPRPHSPPPRDTTAPPTSNGTSQPQRA